MSNLIKDTQAHAHRHTAPRFDHYPELPAGARVLLIGGKPLGEEVLIWWNFVGHDKAEIAEA